jgi:hypothetical protein
MYKTQIQPASRIALLVGVCAATAVLSCVAAEAPTADQDAQIVWRHCTELGIEGRGWTDTLSPYDRLPSKAHGKVPEAVWDLSHDCAGLCARFTTDAPSIQVRWTLLKPELAMPHMPATGVSGIDLYAKETGGAWRFVANGRPAAASNVATFAVSPGKPYLLYFPLYNGLKSIEIGIPNGRTISAYKPASGKTPKPIVFYGTSITQGGCASRPGMAFTAIVGRTLDVPVINLGFSGNGRMELALANLLAELDPSVYVLDCLWNMTPELVGQRVEPFVKRLRQSRPNTPILLVEDYNMRNISPTPMGVVLRSVYEKLKAEGVANLYLLGSQDVLGTDGEGTVDGCHLTDLGMLRAANAFTKKLASILQQSQPQATNK